MMKKKNWVAWEDVKNEHLSVQEQKELEERVSLRIALRELKEKRENLGLTQVELSKKAKLPRTTITKIETGYQNVSLQKIMQVAGAMGYTIEVSLVPVESSR